MNWDALGAVAELLAAIGVIVSLVYLASQIRYSREQMTQNTRSIEAQVSWAHWNAVYNLYHARVENPDLMALFQTMRSWSREQLLARNGGVGNAGFSGDLSQAGARNESMKDGFEEVVSAKPIVAREGL